MLVIQNHNNFQRRKKSFGKNRKHNLITSYNSLWFYGCFESMSNKMMLASLHAHVIFCCFFFHSIFVNVDDLLFALKLQEKHLELGSFRFARNCRGEYIQNPLRVFIFIFLTFNSHRLLYNHFNRQHGKRSIASLHTVCKSLNILSFRSHVDTL